MKTGIWKFLSRYRLRGHAAAARDGAAAAGPPYGPWFMWADWSFWWICPLMMIVMILVMMAACRFMCSWHGPGDRHP